MIISARLLLIASPTMYCSARDISWGLSRIRHVSDGHYNLKTPLTIKFSEIKTKGQSLKGQVTNNSVYIYQRARWDHIDLILQQTCMLAWLHPVWIKCRQFWVGSWSWILRDLSWMVLQILEEHHHSNSEMGQNGVEPWKSDWYKQCYMTFWHPNSSLWNDDWKDVMGISASVSHFCQYQESINVRQRDWSELKMAAG